MDKHIGPRCVICDYTEEIGSLYADRTPDGDTVKLRPNGRTLCTTCYNISTDYQTTEFQDEGELPLIDPDFEDFES